MYKLSQQSHRPFFFISFFFALGIILSKTVKMPFGRVLLLSVLILFFGFWFRNQRRAAVLFMFIGIVFAGAIYSKSYTFFPKNHISSVARFYRGKIVSVRGIVISDIEKKKLFTYSKTKFVIEVRELKTKWGWKKKSGKLLVNIFREEDLHYGDYLFLEGKLHRPFEEKQKNSFSYRKFLERKSIFHILSVKKDGIISLEDSGGGNFFRRVAFNLRGDLKEIFLENLSKNEAYLMQAVILGDRCNIPKHIKAIFENTGVAHILAISGLHLGIVGFVIFLFLKMLPIPRRGRYFATICLLIFYSFLAGGRPSVVRATIMAVVFLMSFIVEREGNSFNTLGFASLLILLMNPLNLFDVGFQLSFISVFAIIFLYPKFMNMFKKLFSDKQPRIIRYFLQSFAISLSSYLGVAGLIVYYFQIVTPIALVANLIVVPLITAIVALGVGVLFVGAVFPPAVFLFANCIKVLLNLMVSSIFLFVQIPGAYFRVRDAPLWGVLLYYALLLLGAHWELLVDGLWRRSKKYVTICR